MIDTPLTRRQQVVAALRDLDRESVYAVIYDVHMGESDVEGSECYYGFFPSPETARAQYEQLRGGDAGFRDAHLVRLVEQIPDLREDPLDSIEVGRQYEMGDLREMFPGALFVGFDLDDETADRERLPDSHPRHPDPRCFECGERLGDADRAEVFLTGRTESAWNYGPFLVHADPCYTGHRDKYDLA